MKEQLEQRLTKLKAEYEAGQKMLADFEAKAINLQKTLLRISGAIQVLEEELSQDQEISSEATLISIPEPDTSELEAENKNTWGCLQKTG